MPVVFRQTHRTSSGKQLIYSRVSLSAAPLLSGLSLQMLLRTMDQDHDGKVSLEEFVTRFTKSMPADPHKFHAQSHRMRTAAQARSVRLAAQRAIPQTTCYECMFQPTPGSCGQPKVIFASQRASFVLFLAQTASLHVCVRYMVCHIVYHYALCVCDSVCLAVCLILCCRSGQACTWHSDTYGPWSCSS